MVKKITIGDRKLIVEGAWYDESVITHIIITEDVFFLINKDDEFQDLKYVDDYSLYYDDTEVVVLKYKGRVSGL